MSSILACRLLGESGIESPSEFRLYECSDLIGRLPSNASDINLSFNITAGILTSRSRNQSVISESVDSFRVSDGSKSESQISFKSPS